MSRVSETVDALGENTFDLAAGSPFSQPFFWQVTSCHRFGTTALAKINYLKTTLSDRRAISVIVRKGEDDESTLDFVAVGLTALSACASTEEDYREGAAQRMSY